MIVNPVKTPLLNPLGPQILTSLPFIDAGFAYARHLDAANVLDPGPDPNAAHDDEQSSHDGNGHGHGNGHDARNGKYAGNAWYAPQCDVSARLVPSAR